MAHTIDLTDGKTKGCDRSLTFDNFVNEQRLGEEEKRKDARLRGKVSKTFRKFKARFRNKGGRVDE